MIAARQFHDISRGLGRNAFDLPVAALAALAVAVFAFAIPADLLGDAVAATGLPSLLTAAEPPLGLKARAAIGLVGAVTAFALVFFLMRRLDGGAKAPAPAPAPLAVGEEELPKLRRRDSHPDAPARRPILAARDLGEPAPPARASTPVWLGQAEVEIAPEPEPEPKPVPEPEPTPPVEASLPDLMARLERGLARRRDRQVFARPLEPQSAPAPQVFPEAGDDRLQSAIDSLQRLAARGD